MAVVYTTKHRCLSLSVICFQQECIIFEVMISDKQCNFVALYRSPSQNQDELDSFSRKLEMLALNNHFMIVFIGDLNAKSKN